MEKKKKKKKKETEEEEEEGEEKRKEKERGWRHGRRPLAGGAVAGERGLAAAAGGLAAGAGKGRSGPPFPCGWVCTTQREGEIVRKRVWREERESREKGF